MIPQIATETFEIPEKVVGKVIGKGGETVQALQKKCVVDIDIENTHLIQATVSVTGESQYWVNEAVKEIKAMIPQISQRVLQIPEQALGKVIGKDGETEKALQKG